MPAPFKAALTLDPTLESALTAGHPWVYRNHLPKHSLQTGDWVRVIAGSAEAYGLFDADGQIAVRLFGNVLPEGKWLEQRLRDAATLRAGVIGPDTNAYRLVYGEGDFLPGIVNDVGELLAVHLTPGNTDDRKPLEGMTENLFGKLFGDKGYLSQAIFEKLYERGLALITSLRRGCLGNPPPMFR